MSNVKLTIWAVVGRNKSTGAEWFEAGEPYRRCAVRLRDYLRLAYPHSTYVLRQSSVSVPLSKGRAKGRKR